MGDRTKIEWTEATWNPVRGCSIVSKGCSNCYAMRQAHRSSGAGGAYEGLTKITKGGPVWTGDVRLVPELLEQPRRWRRPRRIFVNSMSDLFHEDVPAWFIGNIFFVMAHTQRHVFQILTKRPRRMLEWVAEHGLAAVRYGERLEHEEQMKTAPWPLPNVWLGVSVEDQASAEERIPFLLKTPAAVRWISAEPLLGPIDLTRLPVNKAINDGVMKTVNYIAEVNALRGEAISNLGFGYAAARVDWVVTGGESGPGARPTHPGWVRKIRDDCARWSVPFFFKQWGSHLPGEYDPSSDPGIRWQDGTVEWYGDHADIKYADHWLSGSQSDKPVIAWPTSKSRAGRQLDGRTHDQYPA